MKTKVFYTVILFLAYLQYEGTTLASPASAAEQLPPKTKMTSRFQVNEWNTLTNLQPENIDFVQIGSNCGTDACAECGEPIWKDATRFNWTGTVVEPIPRVFEDLQSNYAPYENVEAVNIAICETTGSAEFFVPKNVTTEISSLLLSHLEKHGVGVHDVDKITVTCLSLEDFWQKHVAPHHDKVDILHIDIEGMDHKIILSTKIDNLSPQPTCILYENFHIPADERLRTEEHLRKFGYDTFKPWPGCGKHNMDMLTCRS